MQGTVSPHHDLCASQQTANALKLEQGKHCPVFLPLKFIGTQLY